MKKILLILLIFTLSFSDETQIEKKIYESIFSALVADKKPLVYTDKSIEALNLDTDKFIPVCACKDADIVVMTDKELPPECTEKIVFATRYRHLKKPYVVGAFFWQKGRPNIVFLADRLQKYKIVLPDDLAEYVE